MQGNEFDTVCEGLLLKIFQQPAQPRHKGMVVAFTSPHPGAGVSQITRALAAKLLDSGDPLSIALDCRDLNQHAFSSDHKTESTGYNHSSALWSFEGDSAKQENWQSSQKELADTLELLRSRYRFVLLDCPSLKEAVSAVRLAPLVDGVVLVIEANRTQKQQLLHAERTIENAKGKILGHVLNKRDYVVPNWFYRKMEAAGV
jgi:Mrp family chromosome partitioning ATPase